MATSSVPQLHPNSLDTPGLSVISASKDPEDGRYGLIYNPATLAAGAPVHFHQVGTKFLALFSRIWTNGTGSEDSPGYYADYDEAVGPHWALVDTSGSATNVGPIPMRMAHSSVTLEAATSRVDLLWTLNTVDDKAVVQLIRRAMGPTYSFQLQAEEIVPGFTVTGQKVEFNRGLYLDAPHMYFFGSRASSNAVYLARKRWERLGTPNSTEAPWEYQTATGWSSDPTEAHAVQSSEGPLGTIGPISVATYRDRRFITTVSSDGTNRLARVWVSKGLHDPWRPVGSAPLGTSTTYLGGTLYLQQHLGVLPDLEVLQDQSNSTAILAMRAVKSTVESEDAIQVTWDTHPVPRSA